MTLNLGKSAALCLCALFLAWTQPAGAIVYDFDRISSQPTGEWAIHTRDNWTETAPVFKLMAYTWLYHHWGVPAGPCTNRVLTEVDGGTTTHHAQRPNNGGWAFNLTGVTNFALQSEAQMDYHPSSAARGHGGFGIGSAAKWFFQFGVGIPDYHTAYHAYVQTQNAAKKTYFDFPFALTELDIVELRMDVDTQDNWNGDLSAYEGRGRVYAMKRGLSTNWQLLADNVNLQLATMGVGVGDADRLNVWLQTALTGQDSLQVVRPGGNYAMEAFLDKNLDGVKNGSDEALGSWAYEVRGPDACGEGGLSPYAGTTDGAGSATVTGGTATLAGLNDGDYTGGVTRQDYYYAAGANPTGFTMAPGGGNMSGDFGFCPVLGDANIDGTVNLADFTILKANFGNPGGWAAANFNEDTVVNLADFTILKAHFGESHPDKTGGTGVPEPATMALLLAGGAILLRRRK